VTSQTVYPLYDANGKLVAKHVREDLVDGKKRFWWQCDGHNNLRGLPTAQLPLYRLPNLVAAHSGARVSVTEGEKAADALARPGVLAVGTVTGASGTPGEEALRPLIGHEVILWPDDDDAGRDHMNGVAARLADLGVVPRIVDWAEGPEHGDAADFSGNDEELEVLVEVAEAWQPSDSDDENRGQQQEKGELECFRDDNDKLVLPRIARELHDQAPCMSLRGRLYRYRNGVYRPYGVELVRRDATSLLGDEYSQHRGNEIVGYLRDQHPVEPDDLAPNAKVLNVVNGLLNVETLDLRPHDADYLSMLQVPHEYDPHADCPNIDKFLHDVLPPDCIELAYELLGYILRRDLSLGKAFLFLGEGRNGKSVLIEVAQELVGHSNVCNVALQDFGQDRFASASLHGKLLNCYADIPDHALENSSVFKAAVDGDWMSAQHKGHDRFDFKPFAVFLFSANEIPGTRDRTFGYYNRWHVVPFPNRFLPKDDAHTDRNELVASLTAPEEMRGLLVRSLQAARGLAAQGGFTEPESVAKANLGPRRETDNVAFFVTEECVTGASQWIPRQAL